MEFDLLTTDKIIGYFKRPKLFLPENLYNNKELIPNEKGIYGWYFNYYFESLFEGDSIKHLIYVKDGNHKKYALMYIGITEINSKQKLRDRIYKKHLCGSSRNSTVRKSLASLLSDKLSLDPQNKLNGQDRMVLNSWLFKYGRVAWIDRSEAIDFERKIFDQIGAILPLNYQCNKNNPWRVKIRELRKPWAN